VKKFASKETVTPKKEDLPVKETISATLIVKRDKEMLSAFSKGAIDKKTLVSRQSSPPTSPPRGRDTTLLADRTFSPTQQERESLDEQLSAEDPSFQGDRAESCFSNCFARNAPPTPGFPTEPQVKDGS
jgi:hypothetical protein